MEPGVTIFSCTDFGTSDVVFSVILTTTIGLAFSVLSVADAWNLFGQKKDRAAAGLA
jgi:hypothetical protein